MANPSISFNKDIVLKSSSGDEIAFERGLVYSVQTISKYEDSCDIHLRDEVYLLEVPYANLSIYGLPEVIKAPDQPGCGGCNPTRVPSRNSVTEEPPKADLKGAAAKAGKFLKENFRNKTQG